MHADSLRTSAIQSGGGEDTPLLISRDQSNGVLWRANDYSIITPPVQLTVMTSVQPARRLLLDSFLQLVGQSVV
jgi:hypothetical protein